MQGLFDRILSMQIDARFLMDLGNQSFFRVFWFFFINGGYWLVLLVFIWGLWKMYVLHNENKFAAKQTYIFLAIDIPKTNLQSPKAVENVFAALSGAHMPLEWEEKAFEGQFQLPFSFEIVSIDGYVQFVVRTPIQWRHLVEAAFYSQYPDAEITEVEDYTAGLDLKFPNDEYNLWGADFTLAAPYYFPIKTYPEFEHQMSQEIKDPMVTMLEVMSKIKKGEQIWFQIMVYPTDLAWVKAGEAAVRKMAGETPKVEKSKLAALTEEPAAWLSEFGRQLMGMGAAEPAKPEKKPFFALPPIEKIKAEGIIRKLSKIGFYCKVRLIYLAKREVFNKGLGVSGPVGAIKQFADLHLNGLKPDINKTAARWPWFKKLRLQDKQNRVFRAYKKRDSQTASPKFILNLEELATLYHFPFYEKPGSMVKKIESKKAAAPVGLPLDADEVRPVKKPVPPVESSETVREPVVDYTDDYFENKFAKDKTQASDRARKAEILEELKEQRADAKTHVAGPIGLPVVETTGESETSAHPLREKAVEGDQKTNHGGGLPPANLPFAD